MNVPQGETGRTNAGPENVLADHEGDPLLISSREHEGEKSSAHAEGARLGLHEAGNVFFSDHGDISFIFSRRAEATWGTMAFPRQRSLSTLPETP